MKMRFDLWNAAYIVLMCYFTAIAFVVLAFTLLAIAAALSTVLFLLDDQLQFPQPVRLGYLLFLVTVSCFGASSIVGWLRWPKCQRLVCPLVFLIPLICDLSAEIPEESRRFMYAMIVTTSASAWFGASMGLAMRFRAMNRRKSPGSATTPPLPTATV